MAVDVARPQGAARGGPPTGPAPETQSFWSKLVEFYHGVVTEMKKVTWPDAPQVRQATIAIIIFVLLLALVITLLDMVLNGLLVQLLPSLFAKG